MKTINIYQAKTSLSSLLNEVLAGEEIVIAKNGEPIVRLLPYERSASKRVLGKLKGKIKVAEDFDAPLPKALLDSFYK